jgi:hypothetical protein
VSAPGPNEPFPSSVFWGGYVVGMIVCNVIWLIPTGMRLGWF